MLLFLCFGLILVAFTWNLLQGRQGARLITPTPARVEQVSSVEVAVIPTPTPVPPVVIQIEPGADVETQILTAIYKKVNPSVVNITVRQRAGLRGDEEDFFTEGQGSGFVWDKRGYIVTNDHVVADAAEVEVTFWNDVMALATVVGADPDTDLAVIRVDVDPDQLIPVELGDSDTVQVGDRAIAIGNPFGYEGTMTVGIVSAVGRSIPSMTSFQIPEAIQTDAAINPGNSGGPLLDTQGRVIGVNAQIRSLVRANSGVGFAIPVNLVKRVVPALIERGRYEHPWLGISGQTITPLMAQALELPVERGILIAEVIAGSPAKQAGLRPGARTKMYKGRPVSVGGDIIVQIDDRPLNNFDDLLIYLTRYTSPGQEVILTVIRDGERVEVPVILGTRPTRLRR